MIDGTSIAEAKQEWINKPCPVCQNIMDANRPVRTYVPATSSGGFRIMCKVCLKEQK